MDWKRRLDAEVDCRYRTPQNTRTDHLAGFLMADILVSLAGNGVVDDTTSPKRPLFSISISANFERASIASREEVAITGKIKQQTSMYTHI